MRPQEWHDGRCCPLRVSSGWGPVCAAQDVVQSGGLAPGFLCAVHCPMPVEGPHLPLGQTLCSWKCSFPQVCLTPCLLSPHPVLRSTVPLLQVISRGSPMSLEDSGRIIPLFYLFSSLFSHSLISIHDNEFFGDPIEGEAFAGPFCRQPLAFPSGG